MAPTGDGVELLIGARWDPRLGPVVLAGAGGVYAEVLGDTAVALAPIDPEQARAMIASLRFAPLLDGARGRPPLDLGAAAAALAALSRVAAAHPELAELEVNPLLVLPAGALALDARAVHIPEETDRGVHLHPRAAGAARPRQPLTEAMIPFEIPCEEGRGLPTSRWPRSAG